MRAARKTEEQQVSSRSNRPSDGAGARAVALPAPGADAPLQLRAGRPTEDTEAGPLQFAAPSTLPGPLRAGIEHLSGVSMSDVRVHYASSMPARMHAQAFTRGTAIHLAPGHERHLPHEAWHAVQQKQGRVHATARVSDAPLNDDPGLEREADIMGARAERVSFGASFTAGATARSPASALPSASGAPVQRAGDYTGLMPKHEATGAPKYRFGNGDKDDYTYHHIIPENYIESVYAKVKVLIGGLDNAQSPASLSAKGKRDAFETKALGWWAKVSAREITHFVNVGAANLPVKVSISDVEVLQLLNTQASTVVARGGALVTLVKDKTRKALTDRVEALLMNVDETSIHRGTSSARDIKDLLEPYLDVDSANRLRNADVHNSIDRRTPAARANNFSKVARATAPLATDEAIEKHINYDKGTKWGVAALKQIVQKHGLDNADSADERREKMMRWIPGNIHQGPKSEYRLQGSQNYQTGVTAAQNAPDGGENYDVTRDDGGGNFEWSAAKVLKAQHFTDLLAMKDLLEDLDANPNQVDKVEQMFEVMGKLYDHGLTLFKDTHDKWAEDANVGKMRFG